MTVKQRLIDYIKYKKISKIEFGRQIGVSSAFVTSIIKSIQPDKIERITLKYPDLDIGWLLTGNGEMLKENNENKESKENINISTVPLLPISAQGGSLNDFVISINANDCEKIISPIIGADFAISVTGDSMAPEYPSGSQILIKRINERAFIEWGKVYVLDTCNGSVIKKIMPSEDVKKVRCVSINQDFPPFEVCMEDVYGMYKVLLCMSIK